MENKVEVGSEMLEKVNAFDKSNARSPSDTFLSKSETRSTFDLQRRLRLLLGQEFFDSNFLYQKISAQNDSTGCLSSSRKKV